MGRYARTRSSSSRSATWTSACSTCPGSRRNPRPRPGRPDKAWPSRGVRHTVGVRTSRLEAFSDGVFAIAATLLVLELRVPPDTTDLVGALLRLWPAYAAYLVSFLTIGIIWVNHHTLLEHCTRVDRRFLYLNLLLLIAVGIVPFPTALVDQYILSDHGATVALVVYGMGGLLIAVGFTGVFLYATHDDRVVGDKVE